MLTFHPVESNRLGSGNSSTRFSLYKDHVIPRTHPRVYIRIACCITCYILSDVASTTRTCLYFRTCICNSPRQVSYLLVVVYSSNSLCNRLLKSLFWVKLFYFQHQSKSNFTLEHAMKAQNGGRVEVYLCSL